MTMHPSLGSAGKKKKHRSVLKRFERLKELSSRDKWKEGDGVFGLPKLKIQKVKTKKEKAPEPAVAEGAAEAAGAQAPAKPEISAKKPEAAAKKPEAKKK